MLVGTFAFGDLSSGELFSGKRVSGEFLRANVGKPSSVRPLVSYDFSFFPYTNATSLNTQLYSHPLIAE